MPKGDLVVSLPKVLEFSVLAGCVGRGRFDHTGVWEWGICGKEGEGDRDGNGAEEGDREEGEEGEGCVHEVVMLMYYTYV